MALTDPGHADTACLCLAEAEDRSVHIRQVQADEPIHVLPRRTMDFS